MIVKLKFHKEFDKHFRKLRPGEQNRARERIKLFASEPFHQILNNHALKGQYTGYRSINITGDIRAVYRLISEDTVLFLDIESHSNLYR